MNPVLGFLSSVPTKVLPPGLFIRESYEAWNEVPERFHELSSLTLLSTSRIARIYPPVYPIGPILCSNDRLNLDLSERDRMLGWLDDQPESSVVFLCFGSLKNLAVSQIKEITQALELVGCRFPGRFEQTRKSSRAHTGISIWASCMVGLLILAHKAIGGFVSHCGWISILESLRFGVPIATSPMYAEQQLNAFTMVKELGLALEMRFDHVWVHGDIMKADQIALAVRSLIEDEDVPRRKLKEIASAKETMIDDGSSFVAVKRFIDEVIVDALEHI